MASGNKTFHEELDDLNQNIEIFDEPDDLLKEDDEDQFEEEIEDEENQN